MSNSPPKNKKTRSLSDTSRFGFSSDFSVIWLMTASLMTLTQLIEMAAPNWDGFFAEFLKLKENILWETHYIKWKKLLNWRIARNEHKHLLTFFNLMAHWRKQRRNDQRVKENQGQSIICGFAFNAARTQSLFSLTPTKPYTASPTHQV